ncbi:hypothetical protein C8T65DRAFT_8435 [Cerioporus squamosus]|nr:hypothetical protein C8T65DRAFT_8435 [Cerioporus squamosus]
MPEGTRSVDMLLFPVDADSPRIVRVHYDAQTDHYDGEESHDIDWKPLLGDNAAFTSLPIGSVEMRPGITSMPLTSSRLYLAFNDCFAIDGSPINRCAEQLTGGSSSTEWRGNLVGYCAREPADTLTQFLDVSMSDLAQYVRFLKYHGGPPTPVDESEEESVEEESTGSAQSKDGQESRSASVLKTEMRQMNEDVDGIEKSQSVRTPDARGTTTSR